MTRSPAEPVDAAQIEDLTASVAALMRQFKLEPGMLAGSAYADLHINDVSLLKIVAEPGDWTVRGLAQSLSAPDSTVSSALDRLEGRGLVARRRHATDRRVMVVELTADGAALAERLRAGELDNSRRMLARLSAQDRAEIVRLMAAIARGETD